MKDSILIELAERWEREANASMDLLSSEDDPSKYHFDKARRECKREHADTIKTLISLLGDKNS